METPESLRHVFLRLVELAAEAGDVYPTPVVHTTGGHTVVEAVAGDAGMVLGRVRAALASPETTAVAFGLDRTTRPDQGTTKGNVFTYAILVRGLPPTFGIVEYDVGDVAPPREGPEIGFWFDRLAVEVATALPGLSGFGVEVARA